MGVPIPTTESRAAVGTEFLCTFPPHTHTHPWGSPYPRQTWKIVKKTFKTCNDVHDLLADCRGPSLLIPRLVHGCVLRPDSAPVRRRYSNVGICPTYSIIYRLEEPLLQSLWNRVSVIICRHLNGFGREAEYMSERPQWLVGFGWSRV